MNQIPLPDGIPVPPGMADPCPLGRCAHSTPRPTCRCPCHAPQAAIPGVEPRPKRTRTPRGGLSKAEAAARVLRASWARRGAVG